MFAKHRLEALSDGIFAVAMTLLVIDLKVPADVPHGQLAQVLLHERVAMLGFAITFGIAARYWVLQNRVFAVARELHQSAVSITMIFLCFVTLLPFTTALMSRYGSDPLVFKLYCLNQGMIGAMLIVKLEMLVRRGHDTAPGELRALRSKLWSLVLAMVTAGACSYLMPMQYVFYVPALILIVIRRLYRDKPQAAGVR